MSCVGLSRAGAEPVCRHDLRGPCGGGVGCFRLGPSEHLTLGASVPEQRARYLGVPGQLLVSRSHYLKCQACTQPQGLTDRTCFLRSGLTATSITHFVGHPGPTPCQLPDALLTLLRLLI